MRVTQQMLNNNFLSSIRNNLSRIEKIQTQVSTTKRINKPSDDPVGFNYAMRYRSEISSGNQYRNNVASAGAWLEHMDIVIQQAVEVVKKARELTVQGADGTNSELSLEAIAEEIDQLSAHLRDLANSKFNGQYVFNGQRTDQPPYPDEPPYNVPPDVNDAFNKGKIEYELSPGVLITVNFHAGEIFGGADDPETNVFNVLHSLSNALRAGDQDEIQAALGNLDVAEDRMLEGLASLGAKVNRVELIDKRLEDGGLNTTALLSLTEDADMLAVYTDLKMAEHVYQSSLAAGARIMQPSLLDFLR